MSADVLDVLLAWVGAGETCALATVVSTWGSSPRPVGSRMVIASDGRFEGSVSGGCIEGAVILEAGTVLQDGVPKRLEYGVTDERAWSVGLSCGGRVEVFLEAATSPSHLAVLTRLVAERAARRPVARVVTLDGVADSLIDERGILAGDPLAGDVSEHASRALREQRSGVAELGAGRGHPLFVHVESPAPRLFVVGAVHIAQAMVPMAASLGYEVTVIDPREAFARAARFPGADVVSRWPRAALPEGTLDRRSAVVTLSHDPKIDDPALEAALGSEAFYVGALGSRRTHAARRERLGDRGWTEESLDRIHGPVGLDIGARTPAEIGLSVLAQITAELRRVETSSREKRE